jgi:cephalosporin hydroxylase
MADVTRLTSNEMATVDAFHRLYYPHFRDTRWLGVYAAKCPFDLFAYAELIHSLRPERIVECGTFDGGSALFLASICQLIDHGEVLSIDIEPRQHPNHPRISYFTGSSIAPETLREVERFTAGRSTLVILDDDHSRDHVLKELRCYKRFVTPGSYLIVEDTCVNGHPILPEFGPGPMEAVQAFMAENAEFEIDRSWEKFLLSFNPCGFLRKRITGSTPHARILE